MKRLIKLMLAMSMIVTLIPKSSVFALDTDELIEQELEVAIISGDGSAENPYEVDYSKAPHFKEYMDSINAEVMLTLKGTTGNNSLARGIYDNILIGSKIEDQNNGGEWKYVSGAPSVAYNGNIWMKKVVYVSANDTKAIYEIMKNDKFADVVALKNTIANGTYTAALAAVTSAVGNATAAKAFLISVGKFNALFATAEILKFINDYFVESKYQNAATRGYGMINATYQTSYNGSWYNQYGEDSWTTANDVYLPKSNYGTGTYRSY